MREGISVKRIFALLAGSALFCISQFQNSAYAQTTDLSATDSGLEEIIVTSQKREEKAQAVPIAISVFSGQQLSSLGIQDAVSISNIVPNVTLQDNGDIIHLNVRGVTLNDSSDANENPVGLYIDEVYQAAVTSAWSQIYDVDRVEFLRGPQGTLYGRNTTGGLASYFSRRPTQDFNGYVQVQVGDFGQIISEGAVGFGLTDRLSLRVAFKTNNDNGYQTNTFNNTQFAAKSDKSARIQLLYDANDSTSLLFSAHYTYLDDTQEGYGFFGLLNPKNGSQLCSFSDVIASKCVDINGYRGPPQEPTKIMSASGPLPRQVTGYGSSLTLKHDFESIAFTSISAFEASRRFEEEDFGAEASMPSDLDTLFSDAKEYSEEARLNGVWGPLTWVGGFYGFWDRTDVKSGFPAFGSPIDNDSQVNTDSYSLFGQGDYALADGWTATLGVRLTDETRTHDGEVFGADYAPGPIFQYSVRTQRATGKVGLQWQPSVTTNVYASISKGFKSAGFNTTDLASPAEGAPIGPETVTSYEVGLKQDLPEIKSRINVSAFYMNYNGVQQDLSNSMAQTILLSIGNSINKGFELEAQTKIIPGITVSLSPAYLNTEVVSSNNGYLGNQLADSPKWSIKGLVRYEYLWNENDFFLQGDFRWQSHVFFTPDDNIYKQQAAYGVGNIRIGWKSPEDKYSVEAFVNNFTDTHYFSSNFELSGFTGGLISQWGLPRWYGFMGRVKF